MGKYVDVLNVGYGNITGILNAITRAGFTARCIESKSDLLATQFLILPGVGHFSYAINKLKKNDLFEPLIFLGNERKVPILGICLGMQLLCKYSDEGESEGLGLVPGYVKALNSTCVNGFKVPHIGWSSVSWIPSSINQNNNMQYFAHSFFVDIPPEYVMATSSYPIDYCVALKKNNIMGVQFHPEKSHSFGHNLLVNALSSHEL